MGERLGSDDARRSTQIADSGGSLLRDLAGGGCSDLSFVDALSGIAAPSHAVMLLATSEALLDGGHHAGLVVGDLQELGD